MSDMTGARVEVEGLAGALESLAVYVYSQHPEARAFVAGTLGWMFPDHTKVWELRDEELPDELTEAEAKAAIDRLRAIWRDGYDADPLFGASESEGTK